MTEYTIRAATLDDVDIITGQRSAMFRDMGRDPARIAQVEPLVRAWLLNHMAEGSYEGFLMMAGDTVAAGIGLAFMDYIPGPMTTSAIRGYLYNVYTAPPFRRQGLATRLVEHCIAICRARQITVVQLTASEEGQLVYERMGFVTTREMLLRLD
jgi:ribosomal protein S18 acetylase RimI-like enzyme